MKCPDCDLEYEPKQEWIHVPCRYMAGLEGRAELLVNHVPKEKRGRVTHPGQTVTPVVLSVTELASRVTQEPVGVTEPSNEIEPVTRSAHALRQERYRERQKAKVDG